MAELYRLYSKNKSWQICFLISVSATLHSVDLESATGRAVLAKVFIAAMVALAGRVRLEAALPPRSPCDPQRFRWHQRSPQRLPSARQQPEASGFRDVPSAG